MSKVLNNIVPNLRFPEYNNAGDWESKTLEQLGEFKNGINFSPDKKGKGFLTVDVLNMYGSGIEMKFDSLYRVDIDAKEYLLKNGDILFVRSSLKKEGIGWASLFKEYQEPVLYCGFLIRFRVKSFQSTNPEFLLHYFRSSYGRSKIISLSGTAAITNISQDSLKSISIYIPNISEQQKIAYCLSSLDELITSQSQKLEALQAHKKGLMQQMFPAEGETVPKRRFKEFENADPWEEKTLEQVANYENGKAHEQDITESGNFIVVNSKFISSEGEVRKFTNTPYCIAKKNDILMVLSDVPNGKAIAKCFFVNMDNLYAVNQRICKLTPCTANGRFLFYVLDKNSYFLSFDDGVKQTNLRKEDVLNCPMLIPKDPKEQQQIADCFSSIDELITAQIEKIEELKKHKKGLMQGLFPIIN